MGGPELSSFLEETAGDLGLTFDQAYECLERYDPSFGRLCGERFKTWNGEYSKEPPSIKGNANVPPPGTKYRFVTSDGDARKLGVGDGTKGPEKTPENVGYDPDPPIVGFEDFRPRRKEGDSKEGNAALSWIRRQYGQACREYYGGREVEPPTKKERGPGVIGRASKNVCGAASSIKKDPLGSGAHALGGDVGLPGAARGRMGAAGRKFSAGYREGRCLPPRSEFDGPGRLGRAAGFIRDGAEYTVKNPAEAIGHGSWFWGESFRKGPFSYRWYIGKFS